MLARNFSLHQALRRSKIGLVAQTRVTDSIRSIGPDAWNACFPGELENYYYHLAIEEAGIQCFAWRYAIVERNGCVLAAMPFFLTDYALDTTLDDGKLRQVLRAIRKRFPGFLTMKLACLGSPQTEYGLAGFHPNVHKAYREEMLVQLISGFEHYALSHGYRLLGVKDIPMRQTKLWNAAAPEYLVMPGLPTAYLNVDFDTVNDYLARLSRKTRKDVRRKLRNTSAIRIEERTAIDDVMPQLLALYQDTKARSKFQFEELTADYFRGVLAHMKGHAFCTLYWCGNDLLAFNLLLKNEHTLLDKFFCMDGERGREHNLYFVSWFRNIQYCLDHSLKRYQSGQAGYNVKRRLKSVLRPNAMLFRHSNPLIGNLLKLVAPLLAMGGEDA